MGQTALLWYLWTENAFFQYRCVLMNTVSTCPSSSLSELCIWICQVSALAVEFACPVLKGKFSCSWQHSNCHMSPGFIVTDNEIWIFFLEKHFGEKWGRRLWEFYPRMRSSFDYLSLNPTAPRYSQLHLIAYVCTHFFFFTQFYKEQETSVFFSLFIASNSVDRCFENHVVCEHLKEYYICINSGNSKLCAFHTVWVF